MYWHRSEESSCDSCKDRYFRVNCVDCNCCVDRWYNNYDVIITVYQTIAVGWSTVTWVYALHVCPWPSPCYLCPWLHHCRSLQLIVVRCTVRSGWRQHKRYHRRYLFQLGSRPIWTDFYEIWRGCRAWLCNHLVQFLVSTFLGVSAIRGGVKFPFFNWFAGHRYNNAAAAAQLVMYLGASDSVKRLQVKVTYNSYWYVQWQSYGTSPAILDLLPDTSERAPTLTPSRRRVLDLPTPEGWKAELTVTRPSSNRTQYRLTTLIEANALSTIQ